MVAYWARVETLFNIGSGSFYPRPKVNSTTMRLTMYDEPPHPASDERLFQTVVRGAFSQRRKMLRNALAPHLNMSAEDVSALAESSGIDFARRGETLSLAEFVQLANTLAKLKSWGQTPRLQN
jgi:16S rRNA (adenine1518-N6/adenine1519-N6)-dimethyltransferase